MFKCILVKAKFSDLIQILLMFSNFHWLPLSIPQTTVWCRYNSVQYNMILHILLYCLVQNIKQSWNHKNAPFLGLTGQLWGVCHEDFIENWPHYNGTALYYELIIQYKQNHKPQCASFMRYTVCPWVSVVSNFHQFPTVWLGAAHQYP